MFLGTECLNQNGKQPSKLKLPPRNNEKEFKKKIFVEFKK